MHTDTGIRENGRKWWFWVALGATFCGLLWLLSSILLPFVAGMMIAYFLDPAADWLERKGMSRTMATSTLIVGFFVVLGLVLLALSPILYEQFIGLMKAMPRYLDLLRAYAEEQLEWAMEAVAATGRSEEAREAMNKASNTLFDMASNFITGLFASGFAIVNLLALLFLTPVVAFYLLRDFDVMVAHVDGLLPREHAPVIREQVREMDRTIAGYLRGQVNVCLLLSLYYAVTLSLCGLHYGILVGVLTGLISFVPFVGAMLGFVVTALIAVFQFDALWQVALVLAVFGFGQFLEGNILVPNLIGDKVGLHPAWVIFGLLAGGALLGFVGMLLAVPISAVIGVLVRFAVARYRESTLYQSHEVFAPDGIARPLPAIRKELTRRKRQGRPPSAKRVADSDGSPQPPPADER